MLLLLALDASHVHEELTVCNWNYRFMVNVAVEQFAPFVTDVNWSAFVEFLLSLLLIKCCNCWFIYSTKTGVLSFNWRSCYLNVLLFSCKYSLSFLVIFNFHSFNISLFSVFFIWINCAMLLLLVVVLFALVLFCWMTVISSFKLIDCISVVSTYQSVVYLDILVQLSFYISCTRAQTSLISTCTVCCLCNNFNCFEWH